MNTIGGIIPDSPTLLPKDDNIPQRSLQPIGLDKDQTTQINTQSTTQDIDIDTSLVVEEMPNFATEGDASTPHYPSSRPRTPVKIHMPSRHRAPSNAELIAASLGIQQRNAKTIIVDQNGLNTSYVFKHITILCLVVWCTVFHIV